MTRHWRGLLTLLFVLVFIGAWSEAGANMAKWWHDGEGHGPLVPRTDTNVSVDSEDLVFEVAPSLDHADVTATYRMTNGSAVATGAEVAFVVVAAELASAATNVPRAAIAVDGVPTTFRVVTEADVLAPSLDRWLAAHPEVDTELERLATLWMKSTTQHHDYDALQRLVPGCRDDCDAIVRWYWHKRNPGRDDTGAWREDEVPAAAAIAIPDEVAKLDEGWSSLSRQRALSWLAFRLDFPAGATRTVTVHYQHAAGSDTSRGVNETFTYVYLLSPAKRWARFDQLHLAVHMPPEARLRASLALKQDGSVYRADLPSLPSGELSLEVMSLRGLPFGMTQPAGYWILLVALMTVATVPLGIGLGRCWAWAQSRRRSVLGCIFGTGVSTIVANGLLVWVLSLAFPKHAFGIGYGPAFGILLLVPLSAAVGIVLSLASSRVSASSDRGR